MDLFLFEHSQVHSRDVRQSPALNLEDILCDGLGDDVLLRMPDEHTNPIVWLLWHMARSEDVGINLVLTGRPQVLDDDWCTRMHVEDRDIGTGMTMQEVSLMSEQLDPSAALKTAGMIAGVFGGMNLFARAIGGWIADQCGNRWGLDGRVKWLFIALFGEGIGLMLFAQATTLTVAIPLMITFAMFVKMSNGATYAVVPFINRRALGAVSGIVGAGGNAGAVALGFLFKSDAIDWHTALFIAGAAVTCVSFASFLITFRTEAGRETEPADASFDQLSTGEIPAAV